LHGQVYQALALASLTRRTTHMATPKKRSLRKPAAKPRGNREEHSCTGPSQGLQKAVRPTAELAAVVGLGPLPRTEITKQLWDYIKGYGLQDAQEKRQFNADATLEPIVGGKKSVSMFELAKLVSQHVQQACTGAGLDLGMSEAPCRFLSDIFPTGYMGA
jgi:upstream activation factor subunit UAF30